MGEEGAQIPLALLMSEEAWCGSVLSDCKEDSSLDFYVTHIKGQLALAH